MFLVITLGIALEQAVWVDVDRVSWYYSGLECRGEKVSLRDKNP